MAGIRQPEIVVTENKVDPTVRVMDDAIDKNVAAIIIYTTNGTKFYYDAAKKEEVDFAADGKNLFLKGVVADKAGVLAKATSCTAAGVITFAFPA